MFFDDVREIRQIAQKVGTAIFVVPDEVEVEIAGAIRLSPEGRATITIEQVREVMAKLSTRQLTDQFVLIRPADKLGEEAQNAILKNLEEPGEKVHFVLVVSELSGLVPTIRSRAAVYVLKVPVDEEKVVADEKTKLLAKRILVARPQELVPIAEELTKKKDGVREHVLSVLAVAIEMSYKSYLKTGKSGFLSRTEKLLATYAAIAKNGQIKLQFVANLV